ncbi:MAG: GntR family transcriptional regulator [Burkholderiales bacterium]|nr:GntR family transcriptional regulator [Burkholderiales bacterium]
MPRKQKKRGLDDPTQPIRDAIIEGQFLPNERLVEEDLAPRFHVSRSALRMAFARLEQEGLVTRQPNRGVRVRLVSGREAIEIMQARSMLESLSARHAAIKITDAQLAELRALLRELREHIDSGDMIAYAQNNQRLHDRIVSIGDHATAAKLLLGLSAQSVISQFRPFLEPGRPEDLWREHEALVEALASRDPERVERLMRAHLDQATEVIHTRVQRIESGAAQAAKLSGHAALARY